MSGYLSFGALHPALSTIAEAINDAGDTFHHTMEWQEPFALNDGGRSCNDIIQAAFDAADEALKANGEYAVLLRDMLRRFVKVTPGGGFETPQDAEADALLAKFAWAIGERPDEIDRECAALCESPCENAIGPKENDVLRAVVEGPHCITDMNVSLFYDPSKPGNNALDQLVKRAFACLSQS